MMELKNPLDAEPPAAMAPHEEAELSQSLEDRSQIRKEGGL